MELRVGMSCQQYQRLESMGNPSLSTLALVAKGRKLEVMLIPQEKLRAVEAFLAGEKPIGVGFRLTAHGSVEEPAPSDTP